MIYMVTYLTCLLLLTSFPASTIASSSSTDRPAFCDEFPTYIRDPTQTPMLLAALIFFNPRTGKCQFQTLATGIVAPGENSFRNFRECMITCKQPLPPFAQEK
ncbi:hypothetical protein DPMN_131263 [Dreissena polymorpha]|uniref:BPTI/Kunitz inhibitor domain-containing protein n=1 Tax=Dreissena polymorpha TaxID=45954 RepID=A0A9D4H638_DREPO|nr:hypothetical protein DPMN_131263 [Dreissena polymorpha]